MLFANVIRDWNIGHYFMHPWFWSAFLGWIVAQTIKMVLAAFKKKIFDFEYLVSTGGMPSSHSASVCGLAAGIGYTYGFDSPLCVLAVAFAVVTMFDAATVRRAAGEHAKVLNAVIRDLKELKFKPKERFRELLGHTRTEVVWGMITGILWATLVCAVF